MSKLVKGILEYDVWYTSPEAKDKYNLHEKENIYIWPDGQNKRYSIVDNKT